MRADRILTLLIVASVVLALVATLHPSWRGGRGSRSDPGSQIKLGIPPSDEVRVRLRRIENKTLVIQRLDVGELTLFEAAAAFHHLNLHPRRGAGPPGPVGAGTPGAPHRSRRGAAAQPHPGGVIRRPFTTGSYDQRPVLPAGRHGGAPSVSRRV
jgi:hypothetical protein